MVSSCCHARRFVIYNAVATLLTLRCTAPAATRPGVTQAAPSVRIGARRAKPFRIASTSIRTTGGGHRSGSPPSWHGAPRFFMASPPPVSPVSPVSPSPPGRPSIRSPNCMAWCASLLVPPGGKHMRDAVFPRVFSNPGRGYSCGSCYARPLAGAVVGTVPVPTSSYRWPCR